MEQAVDVAQESGSWPAEDVKALQGLGFDLASVSPFSSLPRQPLVNQSEPDLLLHLCR